MEPETTNNQKFPYIALLLILAIVGVYFLFNKPSSMTTNTTNVQPVIDEQEEPEPTAEEIVPLQNEVKVVIEGSSYKFAPNTITAKIGDKVTVEFKNAEGIHDFKIDEFNAATKIIKAGETDTVSFTVDKAGVFEFYCSVGEHRQLGMVGTLTVTE